MKRDSHPPDLFKGIQLKKPTDGIVSVIGREVAIEAKASALSLQSLGMCSNFQTRNLLKRCFTQDTYFTIRGLKIRILR